MTLMRRKGMLGVAAAACTTLMPVRCHEEGVPPEVQGGTAELIPNLPSRLFLPNFLLPLFQGAQAACNCAAFPCLPINLP